MNAKDILMKAIECDQAGRILEAQHLYEDAVTILMELVGEEDDLSNTKIYFERVMEFINRAVQIKECFRKQVLQGELITCLHIDDGAKGYSYQNLFGKYLSADVTEVLLEEPFLKEKFHFQNLITFLEVVVKNCVTIKYISLVTKPDYDSFEDQLSVLEQIKSDMDNRGISFSIKLEDSLHDRKILLSNGYIIKIGRGLHFFETKKSMLTLGLCDYGFRKCLQTDIDIWRTKTFTAQK